MTRAENPATAHGAGDAPAESERRRNAAPASLAPPAAHSVRRPAPWRAVLSYWLLRYRRIWPSTVVSSFLAPLLYLAGMGYGLGSLVDRPGGTAIDGVSYVAFVATGLVAAQTMMSGSAEATYNVLAPIKWTHTYHAMLATPIRVVDVVRGHLVYILIRLTMIAVVFTTVAIALGAMNPWWAPAVVVVSVLCGMGFASCTFAYAAGITDSGQGFNILQRFIIMPMFLFSGTFFPLAQLPEALQAVAWVSPLTHAVALTRAFGLGPESDWWLPPGRIAVHVAVLVVLAAIGYLLSVRRLTRRMVV
ncbi:MAG TPA: ABC transporter permease [Beutenbergiaceae bacterium]|nr:ABC transporter permease [Beutenbergiaceae bacterium]